MWDKDKVRILQNGHHECANIYTYIPLKDIQHCRKEEIWEINKNDNKNADNFSIDCCYFTELFALSVRWRFEGTRWRGENWEKLGGFVSRLLWRVFGSLPVQCPVRMLRITMIGEWESRGQLANPGLPGRRPLKWFACVRVCIVSFVNLFLHLNTCRILNMLVYFAPLYINVLFISVTARH